MLIVVFTIAVAFFIMALAINGGLDRIAKSIEAQNAHYGIETTTKDE